MGKKSTSGSRLDGEVPKASFVSKLKKASLLVAPTIYVLCIWTFCMFPQRTMKVMPDVSSLVRSNRTVLSVLPPHPSTLNQAWLLGQLDGQLSMLESEPSSITSITKEGILKAAAAVVGRSSLSAFELHEVGRIVKEMEEERGVVSRVLGFFSLVNLMWLLAIVGILVTVGPVLFLIFRPVMVVLGNLAMNFVQNFLIPFLIALKPFYEYVFYFVCFVFLVEGRRYPADSGVFIGMTGFWGFLPAFMYSTYLHSSGGGNKHLFMFVINFFMAAHWIPLTILYDSSLMAWSSAIAVYVALGFNVACYGLCYVIGFEEKKSGQIIGASVLLVALFTILKMAGVQPAFLRPFATPVMTFGNVVFFLALLVCSYDYRRSSPHYLRQQALMISALLICAAVGAMYHIPPMFNTAATFGILYMMQKFSECDFVWRGEAIIFLVFFGSIGLYFLSMFLHSHPEFILSMFDSSFLL